MVTNLLSITYLHTLWFIEGYTSIMRFISGFSTLSLVFASSVLVHASLYLSDIQALVGFPQQCTDAYNTPISDCNGAHFRSGPLCSCSSACSSALDAITNTIINACQGTDASQNTLIGLFYDHAATSFLCTAPTNGGGGGCGTGAAGSSSSSSQQSTSSQTSNIVSSTSQTSSSTATTHTSSSTHTSDSSTSMTMSSSSTNSATSSPTSMSSPTRSNTHSTSSATSKPTSNQSKPTTGGGSPFDISTGAGTRLNVQMQPVVVVLLLFSAFIGLAWS